MFDSNRLQRLQQAPLWDFACDFYAFDKVATACLTLQDSAGVDVCELLFHCWLYRYGLQAQTAALEQARAVRKHWQQSVTQTLRELRRDLKPDAAHSSSIAKLRETIKNAELQAEKENLQAWQAFIKKNPHAVSAISEGDKSALDVGIWLQSRLFSLTFAQSQKLMYEQGRSVESAWRTLVWRLDPVNCAR
ncbi:TIGR02444 family protein [Vreelandella sp. GE22]